jgi:hypothetical protein
MPTGTTMTAAKERGMRTTHHLKSCGCPRGALRFGTLLIVLSAGLAALMAGAAAAQMFDIRGGGSERSGAQRLRGGQAPLVWLEGVLGHDRTGGWVLADGTRLRLAPNLRWRDAETGREDSPSAGRHVRLMGQRRNNVFLVRQATLLSNRHVIERQQPQTGPSREPTPSDEPS